MNDCLFFRAGAKRSRSLPQSFDEEGGEQESTYFDASLENSPENTPRNTPKNSLAFGSVEKKMVRSPLGSFLYEIFNPHLLTLVLSHIRPSVSTVFKHFPKVCDLPTGNRKNKKNLIMFVVWLCNEVSGHLKKKSV